MTIGVDAGALSIMDDRLKVGVWRMTSELLRALSEIDTKNRYRLYSFLPIEKKLMDSFGERMENVVLTPSVGFLNVRIPLELRLHPVDLFLGLSQALPPLLSVPSIVVVHDLGFLRNPEGYARSLQKLRDTTRQAVFGSTRIVSVSEFVKKEIIKTYGVTEKKISVIPEGVSRIFSPRGIVTKRDRPYFLFVGSLRKGKNISFLVESFATFSKKHGSSHDLVLVGGDYWKDEAIALSIKKFHLDARVHVTGYLPDEALAQYYRGATAFVTASMSEGFCLPAAEAMASGCPVIGPKDHVMGETVGDAGILFESNNADDIVAAFEKMSMDGKFRKQCMTRGMKKAREYSWEKSAKQYIEVMNQTGGNLNQ